MSDFFATQPFFLYTWVPSQHVSFDGATLVVPEVPDLLWSFFAVPRDWGRCPGSQKAFRGRDDHRPVAVNRWQQGYGISLLSPESHDLQLQFFTTGQIHKFRDPNRHDQKSMCHVYHTVTIQLSNLTLFEWRFWSISYGCWTHQKTELPSCAALGP